MSNPGTAISYNGNSLQTNNILVDTITHQDLPTIQAKQYQLAHANQSAIPYLAYPSRVITVSGTVIGSSVVDCDAQLDTFKSYLVGVDQELQIAYDNSTRQYIATPTKTTITRPGGLTFAKFSVEFTCNYPFGQDTTSTQILSATGRTLNSYTDSYTFGGTAPFQLPIVTITLTSVTDTTGGAISWGNGNSGQSITVSRTWANSDQLVIDCTQNTVTVNSTASDFTGAFPFFAPGSGSMVYNDTLTSRTFSILITYAEQWL